MSTTARDFFMARLAAARTNAQAAVDGIDAILEHCNQPDTDKDGRNRGEMLEATDQLLGLAATGVQLAMEAFEDIDPKEEEPEEYEPDDDEEDDEEEGKDDGDDGDAQPKRARRRR